MILRSLLASYRPAATEYEDLTALYSSLRERDVQKWHAMYVNVAYLCFGDFP